MPLARRRLRILSKRLAKAIISGPALDEALYVTHVQRQRVQLASRPTGLTAQLVDRSKRRDDGLAHTTMALLFWTMGKLWVILSDNFVPTPRRDASTNSS